jgi:hypothetical protein
MCDAYKGVLMAEDGQSLLQVRLPAELLAEVDAVAGDRGRPTFVRLALRAFLDHLKAPMLVQVDEAAVAAAVRGGPGRAFPVAQVSALEPLVVPADRPIPIKDALALAGLEAEPGQVIALPRARASGRGVDAERVIACLRERRRSARDVANALKMDLATAGEVMGGLIRDGVVRKRADKVLELVE